MQLVNNQLLENLYAELRNIEFTMVEAFSLYLEVSDHKQFYPNPEIGDLLSQLLGWIPAGIIIVKEEPVSLTQKHLLSSWFDSLKRSFRNNIFDQTNHSFALPVTAQNVEIWGGTKTPLFLDYLEEIAVDLYWRRVFQRLDRWRQITGINFYGSHWILNETTVDFYIRWKGAFEDFELGKLKGFDKEFWTIIFPESYPFQSAVTSNASMLRAQLFSMMGGSRLNLIELKENILTISLTINRADTSISGNPRPLIYEEEIGRLNRYINSQVSSKYIKTSKQLETVLTTEISRITDYSKSHPIDPGWVDKFRAALNNLVSIRKKLTELVS